MPEGKKLSNTSKNTILSFDDPDFNKDLSKLEWQTIGLGRKSNYLMPERCVVCYSPSGSATIRTTHQQISGRVRAALSLDFPLCDKCKAVEDTFRRNSTLASLVAFGLSAAGFALFMLVMYLSQSNAGVLICPGLVGAVVLFALLLWLLNWLFAKRFPRPVHERQGRIETAVRITSFGSVNIFFQFSNIKFAKQFQAINKTNKAGKDQASKSGQENKKSK